MAANVSCAEELKAVLRLDRACREKTREGVKLREADVFSVGDLCVKTWDKSCPTADAITGIRTASKDYDKITDKYIREHLLRIFPCLEGVDLSGVLIAGGSICAILTGDQSRDTDIDLFLCGYKTVEELETRAKRLAKDLSNYYIKINSNVTIYRTEHAVSILPHYISPIQIILRGYETPSQVLHGFDIGSCAVGFWNGCFMTTSLGLFAMKYKMNIFDLSRRSTTYEFRLFSKYANRGFCVIVPELDLSKLKPDTRINKFILVSSVDHTANTFSYDITSYGGSDYSVYARNFEDIKYHNIDQFAKPGGPKNLLYGRRCKTSDEVADNIFNIECQYPSEEDVRIMLSNKPIINAHGFQIGRFKKYHGEERIVEAFQAVLNMKKDEETYNKLVEELNEIAMNRIMANVEKFKAEGTLTIPVKWMLDNPGKQLTSSFHPIYSTAEEWFGEYYKEFNLD